MSRHPPLPADLRSRLDAYIAASDGDSGALLEYVAALHGAGVGERWLRMKFVDGSFRELGDDHTRIGRDQLKKIVRLPTPQPG